ncbi:MAG: tetratricopeptide repeat protein, partial [Blastocatellia bacterium]
MTMSKAEDLLTSGKLRSAIQELTAAVKSDPVDSKLRTFLFELFCFAGEWDRAERQLDILGEESPK